jgi:hypothetical protein
MDISQRIEELEAQIEQLEAEKDAALTDWDYNRPYREWVDAQRPWTTQISKLDSEIRMIMPYELSEMPDYGDVMSLASFIGNVKSGGFINSDGFARYVKDGKETNIELYPSDVKHGTIRSEFDTVVWYNK